MRKYLKIYRGRGRYSWEVHENVHFPNEMLQGSMHNNSICKLQKYNINNVKNGDLNTMEMS